MSVFPIIVNLQGSNSTEPSPEQESPASMCSGDGVRQLRTKRKRSQRLSYPGESYVDEDGDTFGTSGASDEEQSLRGEREKFMENLRDKNTLVLDNPLKTSDKIVESGIYYNGDIVVPDGNDIGRRRSSYIHSRSRRPPAFPLPVMEGLRNISNTKPFKLPYSIYCASEHVPKVAGWRPSRKNVWVDVPNPLTASGHGQNEDQRPMCNCKWWCGEDCLNRVLQCECDAATCPLGTVDCGNRALQVLGKELNQGRFWAKGFEVFRTENRGFGLRAIRSYLPGELVVEYTGEVISQGEMQHRLKTEYKGTKNFYFLSLGKGLVIDSGTRGSAARFVNHSCSPNSQMQKWYVNGVPKIGLFAGPTGIPAGTEITYDYNFAWFDNAIPQECRCGSVNCRGIITKRASPPNAAAILKPPLIQPSASKNLAMTTASMEKQLSNAWAKSKLTGGSKSNLKFMNQVGSRPRGRPRKVPIPVGRRPVGRPPKVILKNGKRPVGRPRKYQSPAKVSTVRQSTGRPVGRPRKYSRPEQAGTETSFLSGPEREQALEPGQFSGEENSVSDSDYEDISDEEPEEQNTRKKRKIEIPAPRVPAKRGRGRPRLSNNVIPGIPSALAPSQSGTAIQTRSRASSTPDSEKEYGMDESEQSTLISEEIASVFAVARPGRKRGRPRKPAHELKVYKRTGRPRGRPKKSSLPVNHAMLVEIPTKMRLRSATAPKPRADLDYDNLKEGYSRSPSLEKSSNDDEETDSYFEHETAGNRDTPDAIGVLMSMKSANDFITSDQPYRTFPPSPHEDMQRMASSSSTPSHYEAHLAANSGPVSSPYQQHQLPPVAMAVGQPIQQNMQQPLSAYPPSNVPYMYYSYGGPAHPMHTTAGVPGIHMSSPGQPMPMAYPIPPGYYGPPVPSPSTGYPQMYPHARMTSVPIRQYGMAPSYSNPHAYQQPQAPLQTLPQGSVLPPISSMKGSPDVRASWRNIVGIPGQNGTHGPPAPGSGNA